MRTHYDNWRMESVVGLIVACSLFVLPMTTCAGMLWIQADGIIAAREARVAGCNELANSAAGRPAQAGASSVGADSPWLGGLRADLRGSEAAREAYAVCMDARAYASMD